MSQAKHYALYRLPLSGEVVSVEHTSGEPQRFTSFEALGEAQGFAIAPFAPTADCPIVVMRPDKVDRRSVALDFPRPSEYSENFELSEYSEEYQRLFTLFTAQLREGRMAKVVLSRQKSVALPHPADAERLFSTACRLYPRMFVALVSSPVTGTWLTATPEALLEQGGDGLWHTMALAGTMRRKEGETPVWGDKDRREQRIVAAYVEERLKALNIVYTETGPATVQAGSLHHLRSDFQFTLPNDLHLGQLIAALHPTPAVCGLPKDAAYRFILANEPTPRRYYSGFMGPLGLERSTHLYVTLRCMELLPHAARLIAGGGLVAGSQLEAEWRETENKMMTMGRVLSHAE